MKVDFIFLLKKLKKLVFVINLNKNIQKNLINYNLNLMVINIKLNKMMIFLLKHKN